MLFASLELAARIERAARELVVACTACAAAHEPEQETLVLPIAGGAATFSGPGSPLNKLVGVGFEGPLPEPELEAIEHAFARLGEPLQVELSCLADPAVARMLTARGYALVGFENVLGRTLGATGIAVPEPSGAYATISRVDQPDERSTWLDTVTTGFCTPDDQGITSHDDFPRDQLERAIGHMMRTEGFACYLAQRDAQPVAGGAVRMFEGIAQLCGAATLPAHRRRGVQGALLTTRLAEAADAGCELALVTTSPGTRSQHNVQRQGFELLYTRAILVREPSGPPVMAG